MKRNFRLKAIDIKPLVIGRGSCIASNMITVEGRKVGFMYREPTSRAEDSGWRFMSGLESQAYMDNADNLALYDVNTIANYDSDIIPFLDAPIGSAFERENGSGRFTPVEFSPPDD
jgi:hypothetical protein